MKDILQETEDCPSNHDHGSQQRAAPKIGFLQRKEASSFWWLDHDRTKHRDLGVKIFLMGSKKDDDRFKTHLTCVHCREGSALTSVYQRGGKVSGNFLELVEQSQELPLTRSSLGQLTPCPCNLLYFSLNTGIGKGILCQLWNNVWYTPP